MDGTVRRFGEIEVHEIAAKSIINRVRNMPFRWSINPYQGCIHQCVFCYARRTHAYRELDGQASWGNRLFAKVNAPSVLRAELAKPGWPNDEIALGTATDPYQAIEARYRITRGILEELVRARTPISIITRSPLIARDVDLLTALARVADVHINVSLPTLDATVAREIEPTVASPEKRLATIETLTQAGLRVGVLCAPVIPGITDGEDAVAAVVRAAADAGAAYVSHTVLYLGDVTHEAYFAYLAERRGELVAAHRLLYASTYAPRSYAEGIAARFRTARRAVRFAPPPTIVPEPPRGQLAFWVNR